MPDTRSGPGGLADGLSHRSGTSGSRRPRNRLPRSPLTIGSLARFGEFLAVACGAPRRGIVPMRPKNNSRSARTADADIVTGETSRPLIACGRAGEAKRPTPLIGDFGVERVLVANLGDRRANCSGKSRNSAIANLRGVFQGFGYCLIYSTIAACSFFIFSRNSFKFQILNRPRKAQRAGGT